MKFTTRELLLITAVVGLGIGWVLDRKVYYRRFATVDRLNGSLYEELRLANPAKQIRIKVSCGGVERRYGYEHLPLEEEE